MTAVLARAWSERHVGLAAVAVPGVEHHAGRWNGCGVVAEAYFL